MNTFARGISLAIPLLAALHGCAVVDGTADLALGTLEVAGEMALWTADIATLGLVSSVTDSKDAAWASTPADTIALAGGVASAYVGLQAQTGSDNSYTPDYSASEPARAAEPAFREQGLRDFHISSRDNVVQVCVWDHECEDGDALRVSINDTSYEVQLRNDDRADCRELALAPGRNHLAIRAINGTGYLGSCDHANVNTGTIAIGGLASTGYQQQTWSIRGGAGSEANIFLDIE